jgi:hypothetical protein
LRRLYQNILIMAIKRTQYNELQIVILNLIVNLNVNVNVNVNLKVNVNVNLKVKVNVNLNLNLNLVRHKTHWKRKKTDAFVNPIQFPAQH